MDLHFVSAPGGSAFMHELLTAVAHEVSHCIEGTAIGAVHVSEGPLVGAHDDVFVVVPHEFFRVLPPDQLPDDGLRRRTIGFCVEHPGTDTFSTTMTFASQLGACVDINDDSTVALRATGVRVERFHLGYTSAWDRWGGIAGNRSCDVIYLGTADDRRSRYLSIAPEILADHEVRYATPPHEPMTVARPDFFMGADKHRLLADSRLLLNLHRDASSSFEWVRALEAMSNGCVVLSEHSRDHRPLVPGEHFVAAAPHMLVDVARALLEQPERLARIARDAYDFIRTELTMRASADVLVQLALDIDAVSARPTTTVPLQFTTWPVWPIDHRSPTERCDAGSDPAIAERDATPMPPRVGAASSRSTESIDVIVLPAVGATTDHFDVTEIRAELRLAGETAGIVFVATTFQEANAALDDSSAEFVMVLEAAEQLLPHALPWLRTALGPSMVDATYGFVITPCNTFRSQWPFEPRRVLERDYLATASMWRRSSLRTIGGWDDRQPTAAAATWDLWRRLARQGGTAFHLPRPVVRKRSAQPASAPPVVQLRV